MRHRSNHLLALATTLRIQAEPGSGVRGTSVTTNEDLTPLFQKIRSGPASNEVVRQIKTAIFEGNLVAGDRLPPERELAGILAVSRVTVRDALRTLQANGLIEVRVGAKGGAFITAPESGHVSESITHMLALDELSAAEVTEARVILELGAIPLVCERATDLDIEELDEICDRSAAAIDADAYHVGYSVEFHARLAQAGHNAATTLMIESLHEPVLRSLSEAKAIAPEMGGRRALDEHRAVVDAVRDRDVERAQHILGEHLGRTLTRLGTTDPSASARVLRGHGDTTPPATS